MHRTRREYKVGWQSLFCSFHIDILIVWRQQWNGNMIIVMQRSYPTHTHTEYCPKKPFGWFPDTRIRIPRRCPSWFENLYIAMLLAHALYSATTQHSMCTETYRVWDIWYSTPVTTSPNLSCACGHQQCRTHTYIATHLSLSASFAWHSSQSSSVGLIWISNE